jgi:hypothetical protein
MDREVRSCFRGPLPCILRPVQRGLAIYIQGRSRQHTLLSAIGPPLAPVR